MPIPNCKFLFCILVVREPIERGVQTTIQAGACTGLYRGGGNKFFGKRMVYLTQYLFCNFISGLKRHRLCLGNGSGQPIVTLYTLSIYPSVNNQLIRTIFAARYVTPQP